VKHLRSVWWKIFPQRLEEIKQLGSKDDQYADRYTYLRMLETYNRLSNVGTDFDQSLFATKKNWGQTTKRHREFKKGASPAQKT